MESEEVLFFRIFAFDQVNHRFSMNEISSLMTVVLCLIRVHQNDFQCLFQIKFKMRFFWYFFLLIGSKVEPTSVSFINLLSSIIANGRFVEENYVNSNFPLDSIFPSIDFDRAVNANGSNCSRDMQILSHDLVARQIWALKSRFQ